MESRYRPLFLTGVARSGTNLVGRMLAAHPGAMVAIDAFLPLFRSLRNAIVRAAGIRGFDEDSPLQDFYFDAAQIEILDRIQAADLEIPFEEGREPRVWERIDSRAMDDAADLIPFLKGLRGAATYKELFDRSLRAIADARQSLSRTWVGLKDVWVIDFFSALARSYPEARFIVILRDPRAVVASNHPAKGTSEFGHPLSYARHWRKNVALAIRFLSDPTLSSRGHVVFYEELLLHPEEEARRLCGFLDLPFDSAMLDPKQFLDYTRGGVWKGNSSFGNSLKIDGARASRWRSTLGPEIVKMVEFVCGPEMKLSGYPPENDYLGKGPDRDVVSYYLSTNGEECSWRSDFRDPQRDVAFDAFRYLLLEADSSQIPEDLVRRSFLYREIYELAGRGGFGVLRETGRGGVPSR